LWHRIFAETPQKQPDPLNFEEDSGGTAGSGGDVCTGGLCETADVKIDCEAAVAACKADVELDLTEAGCDAFATELYCNTDTGTGGTGGAGGGTGGTGGGTGVEGCDVGLCLTDEDRQAQCEEFIPACLIYCDSPEGGTCGRDECAAFALVFICNEQ